MLEKTLYVLILGLVYTVVLAIAALPCVYLWNQLMPDIFGLPVIDYGQTFGLMVLSTFFFYRGGGKS